MNLPISRPAIRLYLPNLICYTTWYLKFSHNCRRLVVVPIPLRNPWSLIDASKAFLEAISVSYIVPFNTFITIFIVIHQLSCLSKSFPWSRTTDTQWRLKSKVSEKLGRSGRQNMLRPYLKIWEWEWIFGRAVKAVSSLGVRSPWCL